MEMQHTLPLSNMGHQWLDRAKARMLKEPSARPVLEVAGTFAIVDIPGIVAQVEHFSREAGDPMVVRKRLMHVLVESVDNMSRHAMGLLGDASFALLVRDHVGYHLCTGNAVPCATATLLVHRLEILNEMDPEDLREHYLKLLANENRTANGGAGLGLLTLARKSSRPLVAGMDPLGPYTSFFTLGMRVEHAAASATSAA